jgi:hypothetical protein
VVDYQSEKEKIEERNGKSLDNKVVLLCGKKKSGKNDRNTLTEKKS